MQLSTDEVRVSLYESFDDIILLPRGGHLFKLTLKFYMMPVSGKM